MRKILVLPLLVLLLTLISSVSVFARVGEWTGHKYPKKAQAKVQNNSYIENNHNDNDQPTYHCLNDQEIRAIYLWSEHSWPMVEELDLCISELSQEALYGALIKFPDLKKITFVKPQMVLRSSLLAEELFRELPSLEIIQGWSLVQKNFCFEPIYIKFKSVRFR